MFLLPTICRAPGNDFKFYNGQYYDLPEEYLSEDCFLVYSDQALNGWREQGNDRQIFIYQDSSGYRFIFPDIRVVENESDGNVFENAYPAGEVEQFASSLSIFRTEIWSEIQDDMNLLVHDFRRITSSIYHKAVGARISLQKGIFAQAQNDIEGVISTISLLRLRTETIDITSKLDTVLPTKTIDLIKIVNDITSAFTPSLQENEVNLISELPIRVFAHGNDVIRLIPYWILDNAIKYSPKNSSINLKVNAEAGFATIEINSIGPYIQEKERETIFLRGQRGKFAKKSGRPGSGYGMYLARSILNKLNGTIMVDSVLIGSDEIYEKQGSNTFVVTIPLNKI